MEKKYVKYVIAAIAVVLVILFCIPCVETSSSAGGMSMSNTVSISDYATGKDTSAPYLLVVFPIVIAILALAIKKAKAYIAVVIGGAANLLGWLILEFSLLGMGEDFGFASASMTISILVLVPAIALSAGISILGLVYYFGNANIEQTAFDEFAKEKFGQAKSFIASPTTKCEKCGATMIRGAEFCIECGHKNVPQKNKDEDRVCKRCGRKLQAGQGFCPDCGTRYVVPKEHVCSNCGKTIPAGMDFCGYCGTKCEPALCPKCGCEIEDGFSFCDKCGTKISKE